MRSPMRAPESVLDSRVAAMEMDCSGSRRSWPSIASKAVRARSTSAARLVAMWESSSRRLSAASSSPGSQGVQMPRTTSRQASNEPRGVRRGPMLPTVHCFSGLPPHTTVSICSLRNQISQPLFMGSNLQASRPAYGTRSVCSSG
ncbi:hypothetical protein D3C86_1341630 [compost metagenome]